MRFVLILALLCSFASTPAHSDFNEKLINQNLQEFGNDPSRFMNRHIQKYDLQGKAVSDTFFNKQEISNLEFIESKSFWRRGFWSGRDSAIGDNDRPEKVVDDPANVLFNIYEMENMGLKVASLSHRPWSGYHFPYYKGALGMRHLDSSFPNAKATTFQQRLSYIQAHPFFEIFRTRQQSEVFKLSASEKYDLLVGAQNGITQFGWNEGLKYIERTGGIEEWMGFCHGWAPASYMMDRPLQSVMVKSFDGQKTLKFYPAEIKGLASLLWGTGDYKYKFIGGRCNIKKPQAESSGRIIDPVCNDTNPGTWHVAVVNQIGASRRPLILDATYDYEVWNQPIIAYEYTYFNPQTRQAARGLTEAMVRRANFSADKFAKWRSPNAAFVVGVVMKVTYVLGTAPNAREFDGPQFDLHRKADYYYDLELDADLNVIGGEWYTNKHPDFLWSPNIGTRATVKEDGSLQMGEWDGFSQMPAHWLEAGRAAAARGDVLGSVVEHLIEASQREGD